MKNTHTSPHRLFQMNQFNGRIDARTLNVFANCPTQKNNSEKNEKSKKKTVFIVALFCLCRHENSERNIDWLCIFTPMLRKNLTIKRKHTKSELIKLKVFNDFLKQLIVVYIVHNRVERKLFSCFFSNFFFINRSDSRTSLCFDNDKALVCFDNLKFFRFAHLKFIQIKSKSSSNETEETLSDLGDNKRRRKLYFVAIQIDFLLKHWRNKGMRWSDVLLLLFHSLSRLEWLKRKRGTKRRNEAKLKFIEINAFKWKRFFFLNYFVKFRSRKLISIFDWRSLYISWLHFIWDSICSRTMTKNGRTFSSRQNNLLLANRVFHFRLKSK